jgi:hypothetical protein
MYIPGSRLCVCIIVCTSMTLHRLRHYHHPVSSSSPPPHHQHNYVSFSTNATPPASLGSTFCHLPRPQLSAEIWWLTAVCDGTATRACVTCVHAMEKRKACGKADDSDWFRFKKESGRNLRDDYRNGGNTTVNWWVKIKTIEKIRYITGMQGVQQ